MTLKFVTLGLLALVQVSLMTVQVNATHDPKTVCYYEYWVHYREGNGKMDPSDIGEFGGTLKKLFLILKISYFISSPKQKIPSCALIWSMLILESNQHRMS